MKTIIFLLMVGYSRAQYSHVRYQPSEPSKELPEVPTDYYAAPTDIPRNYQGIPANSYEVPSYTYLTPPMIPEENETRENDKDGRETIEERGKNVEVERVEGAYYVLLPGSRLQRVVYQTENDVTNMAFTARLLYRSEDRAPIFVYKAPSQAYVQYNKQ